jgi:threonine/homoserine/homoserine lactone efflux protein
LIAIRPEVNALSPPPPPRDWPEGEYCTKAGSCILLSGVTVWFAITFYLFFEIYSVLTLNLTLLSAFIPTFFVVSITPGLCMTLALSMGITIGVRRALWMMAGELLGVAVVATSAAVGVAAFMLQYPTAFALFKYAGGAYLAWLGVQMWLSKGRMAMPEEESESSGSASRWQLAIQGFVTAIANPKGWAFFIALLPPFIDSSLPMAPQLTVLILIILLLEFICLQIYAHGGKRLRLALRKGGGVRTVNRVAGSLMMLVGAWLAFG